MTQVDFYILNGAAIEELQRLACRLVDKAWQQGMRTLINADEPTTATALDDLLWTFRDISFLPHASNDADSNTLNRVAAIVACNQPPAVDCGLLINLSPEVPKFFSRFERVAELVDKDPTRRDAGRERFRFYRDRGYPLQTHNL
ncbi:MAG: DNA polymerase III subunit chi [Gammaproteobacteria bacterium]|nr:DNA polymerase III subunit chi [Gammaproteobacteria bacterium]